jgi:superfamily II DNA helicase RecQ
MRSSACCTRARPRADLRQQEDRLRTARQCPEARGLPADAIHGDKSAEARYACLQAFSRGKTRFLVATDVAARGIDVDDIELVVNYEFPLQLEDYVHRTGRTAAPASQAARCRSWRRWSAVCMRWWSRICRASR